MAAPVSPEWLRRLQRHLRETAKHRSGYPISTGVLCRGDIFAPERKGQSRIREVRTPVCTTRVEGRLHQRHAALLEGILDHAENLSLTEDGGWNVTVAPYVLRLDLGGGTLCAQADLTSLMEDLCTARVDLSRFTVASRWVEWMNGRRAQSVSGSLLLGWTAEEMRLARREPDEDGNPVAKTQSMPRQIWRVHVSPATVSIFGHDPLKLLPQPSRVPLILLKTGVAMAVARWALSQDSQAAGGWKPDTLVAKVCGTGLPSQTLRKRRADLKTGFIDADPALLALSGLEVILKEGGDWRLGFTEQERRRRAEEKRRRQAVVATAAKEKGHQGG